jgi:1-acyl-sn-glycerol-3-phosphate acyltransferase
VVVERLKHFKKSEIKIIIGMPFNLPPIQRKNREEILQQYTDEIMCQIGALLPEKYRGVYADHPRLKELVT